MIFWLSPNSMYHKKNPDVIQREDSWFIENITANDWLTAAHLDHNCGGYIYVGF